MGKQTSRNGKVDLLRFIFSICVVLNHAKYAMPTKAIKNMFVGYSLSVEFFFLVSGCLLMASIERAERVSTLSLGRETGAFMLKKFKSMYPDVAVTYVLGVVLLCVFTSATPFALIEKSWFEGFLLLSTGLRGKAVMTVTWYVSSMLICMALLYPFIRKYKEGAVRVVLPLGALLIFGYMYRNYGTVRGPTSWTGLTYRGNLRALAELSMGCVCYCLAKKLKAIDFTTVGRAALAIIETACYAIFIYYMATENGGVKDFFYLLILCIGVIISFSEKSIGHELFNKKVFTALGKFSFPLYLMHSSMAKRIFDIFPAAEALGWKQRLALYLVMSLLSGLVVMLISNLIRKFGPKLGTGIKKLMVKENTAES